MYIPAQKSNKTAGCDMIENRRVQKIVTPPTAYAVTVATAKEHMRVKFDDDDMLIGVYIETATALCEQILQRKLITQTWKMYLDYFPNIITTLFGDLQSVTHIKYTDLDEAQLTFANTKYDVDIVSVPGRIILKDAYDWPTTTLNANNPIEIQFITGYGASSANVPADIKNAILLTTAHFYENRENLLISNMSIDKIPMTTQALLQNHRIWKWIL